MSNQIVKNVTGGGRKITKELSPTERATPNIMDLEGRAAALESWRTENTGIDSTQNDRLDAIEVLDGTQNDRLDAIEGGSLIATNRNFASQDSTAETRIDNALNGVWYSWLDMTATFEGGIVCVAANGTAGDSAGLYYPNSYFQLLVDGTSVGVSFNDFTATYSGAGKVNGSISWQGNLAPGEHILEIQVMNNGGGGSSSRHISNKSIYGTTELPAVDSPVSPATIMTW